MRSNKLKIWISLAEVTLPIAARSAISVQQRIRSHSHTYIREQMCRACCIPTCKRKRRWCSQHNGSQAASFLFHRQPSSHTNKFIHIIHYQTRCCRRWTYKGSSGERTPAYGALVFAAAAVTFFGKIARPALHISHSRCGRRNCHFTLWRGGQQNSIMGSRFPHTHSVFSGVKWFCQFVTGGVCL